MAARTPPCRIVGTNPAEQCIAAHDTRDYLAAMNTRNASDTGSWWRARFVAIARQAESAALLPRPRGAVRIRPGLTGAGIVRRLGSAAPRS